MEKAEDIVSRTFLKHIHLKDFRTFGEFQLPIAPGPGLTLLVGTNGLGKSSFFDGIEWCLTGIVRRFAGFSGKYQEFDYLTRRDAQERSHQVSLTFCDGPPIVRGVGQTPSAAALLEQLKSSRWDNIDDLGAYLAFTHFLGQASQQRFTSREKNDQWQALKGPSGIDRLESIRTKLRGRPTTFAFNRRTDHETALVDKAIRELEAWQTNVARLAELGERAASIGAVDEESLAVRLAAIEASTSGSIDVPINFTMRLNAARSAVLAEQRRVSVGRRELGTLTTLVERFTDASTSIRLETEHLALATGIVTTATTHLSETMLAASRAEQAAAEQAGVLTQIDSELKQHVLARAAIGELETLVTEWRAEKESESDLRAERDALATDLANAKQQLSVTLEAKATLNRLDARDTVLQAWAARAGALNDMERSAQDLRDAADMASSTADFVRESLFELRETLDSDREAERDAAARVAARRRSASELAGLLSGLITHIGHDDTHCPVCASTFSEGELHARAQKALSAQDVMLAEDVHALDELRMSAQAAASALALAEKQIADAAVALTAANAAEATLNIESASIAEGLGTSVDKDLVSIAAERLADARRTRDNFLAVRGDAQSDVGTAQGQIESIAGALASLDDRLGISMQRFARLEARRNAIEASLSKHSKPWDISTADAEIERTRKRLEVERVKLESMTSARAAAANAESAARERLSAANGEKSRVAAALRNAEVSRAAATSGWSMAGMADEPAAESIDARRKALEALATTMTEQEAEIGLIAQSHEAYLAQDELRSLRAQMDSQGGAGAADNPVPREQELQGSLQDARTALRMTTETREALVAYGEQLRAEAESFSNQFLLPLNELIDSFNRALLSTPGESVQFNAEHTVERTSLAMQLRHPDAIEGAQYKTTLPPQLVLSEGQMAANGFSILCAASTAYRWSRWRALLLDDPLQHNDIIHAAAFVDVMRNLVEFEDYQLIMSSHKREEGEFIARKFDAANLPCTVVELVGASKDGVRVAPPRHNAAARRLLVEPQRNVA